jgi:hypothetical protein
MSPIKEDKDISIIPKGIYCYSGPCGTKICPYWSLLSEYNGHCSYLDLSDDEMDGLGLLWDQCKECGIKTDCEDDR